MVWDAENGVWKDLKAARTDTKLPDPLWIFGYGSLCWNVGNLPVAEKRVALLEKGWIRRFYQKSMDHRGTPSHPGLVVTLLKDEEAGSDHVVGVAYRISREHVETVMDDLDFREKGDYSRFTVKVHLAKGDSYVHDNHETVEAIVYAGTTDNPNFAPPEIREDIEAMAKIIGTAAGPSGKNAEYLLKLCEFCKRVGILDEHLVRLEAAVNKVLLD